ncbi:MAG TPA: hypothetical protein VJY42_04085 [Candidatus Methanomethylophilaceae archaeon]|nr:hypothetical protein [Candidatus Methanomethylophilaceae archaeon]
MSLEETVGEQIRGEVSLVERIGLYIPIYRGYKEKNLRRDEDRAVRQEVARTLEGAKNDIATINRASVGDLDLMRDVERIDAKIDQYYISVKKAVNGYSGWHASVKILETELDELVSWDAKLINETVLLRKEIANLVSKIDAGEYAIKAPLRNIENTVERLIEDYHGREAVMKGFLEKK